MIAVPDVNVLVAIAWPNHVHHAAARAWFGDANPSGWATCPITEAGFVRVSSNRRVIPDARGIDECVRLLRALRAVGQHSFWPDDIAAADCPEVPIEQLAGYRQVTDALLLALISRRAGTMVTFDRGVDVLGTTSGVPVKLLSWR